MWKRTLVSPSPGAILLAALSAFSWLGGPGTAAGGEALPTKNLCSEDEKERLLADHNLKLIRKALFEDLRRVFVKREDRTFNGPRHLAVKQMGLWSFREAVMLLARNIDWTVDLSTLQGDKLPPWAKYPAACALRDIGGRRVRSRAILEIRLTDDDTKMRLFSWVLSSMEGPEFAKRCLNEEIKNARLPAIRKRFEKARDYAAKGDAIWAEM